jgi:hypothetical protein
MASGHGVDKPRMENHPGRQVGRDVMLPRLSAAMQRQGILSVTEAQSAIRGLKAGDLGGGGEAVWHYGGAQKLATDAFRNRNLGTYAAKQSRMNASRGSSG